jgi:ribonuclease VapC
MSNSVLDASALLAYLRDEPGALQVEVALTQGAAMSAVNWAEVLSKVAEVDQPQTLVEAMRNQGILGQQLQIYGFSAEDALAIAVLRPLTKSVGLSLADRACLALAKRLGVDALTADRVWADVETGVTVQLIR